MLIKKSEAVFIFSLFLISQFYLVQSVHGTQIKEEKESILSLTIHCEKKELKAGDEIPIIFTIKNKGAKEYKYFDRDYDRSGRMPEYELSAADEHGNSIADPRSKSGIYIGGGLGGEGNITSNKSFSKTIALNRWALLTKPGTYTVTGIYHPEGHLSKVISSPIKITILPRTDKEMGEYIHDLDKKLSQTKDDQERAAIVRKFMYTCDKRIIPILIEAMYKQDAATYWAGEAFNYYLPSDSKINDTLFNTALKRGLAGGMFWTLKQRGFTGEQIKPLIDVSLSTEHPDAWIEGALAAQEFPEDKFMSRLIFIALDPTSPARNQAIFALAQNRTDESVAALKKLLNEPDPQNPRGRTIRQTTEDAIRSAYRYGTKSGAKPLRKDDFDTKYQDPNASIGQ